MAIIDSYRRNIESKRKQILKLQEDKAKEIGKKADCTVKIQRANDAIRRTKFQSTINMKINEISRLEKQSLDSDKKISRYESEISKKEKELSNDISKLQKEEIKMQDKKSKEQAQFKKEQIYGIDKLNSSLSEQARLYEEVKAKVTRLEELPEKIVVLFFSNESKRSRTFTFR